LLKAGSVLKRSFHLSSFLFKLLLLLSSARFIYLNSAPLIEKNLNTEYTTQQSETALTTLLCGMLNISQWQTARHSHFNQQRATEYISRVKKK